MASNSGYSGYFGGHVNRDNRFSRLADGTDGTDEGAHWTRVERNKRQRRSTGGFFNQKNTYESQFSLSTEDFKALPTDDKLVTLFELMTNVGSVHGRIGQVENKVNDIHNRVSQNVSRIKLLEYKSIDAETRSRRHNLLFRGFDEITGEEDCESRVKSMLAEQMSIFDDVYIQRAHRLGQLRKPSFSRFRDNRKPLGPRPIIVCFRDYADVEKIIANSYKLQGTDYGVSRDYPKEIVAARSELWPRYKTERSKFPRSKVTIGFPAKLVINGRVVQDKFPDWFSVLRGSRHHQYTENCETPGIRENFDSSAAQSHAGTQSKETSSTDGQFGRDTRNPTSKQGDISETDDEDRDISMQMTEATAETQDGATPNYNDAMTALERLSQTVNPGAPMPDAPPVQNKSQSDDDPDASDPPPKNTEVK